MSPTPTYSPTSPVSTTFAATKSSSTSSPVVTYVPDNTRPPPRQPTEKQDTTFGLKITTTTLQPSRTVPSHTTSSVTWPLANISEKHHPSWTPPPLEIIPANDFEDPFNHLEESPSNRIPNYEEAPNRIPYSHPTQKQPSPDVASTPVQPKTKPKPASTTPGSNKSTPDTPIITVNDNQENEVPHFHRNDKGGVKYGNKHDGKSLSSAQAKLNMGMKSQNLFYYIFCLQFCIFYNFDIFCYRRHYRLRRIRRVHLTGYYSYAYSHFCSTVSIYASLMWGGGVDAEMV